MSSLRCARSNILPSTLWNGQHFSYSTLWLGRGDRNFFGLEAVVVEAVPVSNRDTVLGFCLIDFTWGSAQWAFHSCCSVKLHPPDKYFGKEVAADDDPCYEECSFPRVHVVLAGQLRPWLQWLLQGGQPLLSVFLRTASTASSITCLNVRRFLGASSFTA